jgi:EAL domain-containing protein (putative c-di-GMP-specific phosphodiesterase class I)
MEQSAVALRPVLLPAVLQVEGQAPYFGTIAGLTDQGLAFDFQSSPLAQQSVGLTAQLDFDLQAGHHSCKGLIVHIQSGRALLSLRGASTNVLAALQSLRRDNAPSLATRLSALQVQQACHTQFMDNMKAVVDDFYLLLPDRIQSDINQQTDLNELSELGHLQNTLTPLRPQLTRQFTQAYPMYPALRTSYSDASSADPANLARVGIEQVDDWIRRTTTAQKVVESIHPLPEEFNRHYGHLLSGPHKSHAHPYHPEAVLDVLADLLTPLGLGPNGRALCYETMGQAFQEHAIALYQALLRIVGDAPIESMPPPQHITNLQEWLKLSASGTSSESAGGNTGTGTAASARINELADLLGKLTENLGELSEHLPASASPHPDAYLSANMLVPGMLAHDRIFGRFLPATAGFTGTGGLLQGSMALLQPSAGGGAVGQVLGGLSDLDGAALQGLHALMRQPPPIDPGPEKLSQASQVRVLMLQAQGLLLEYTLNGLTYQDQPDHPAWTLINALDALHQGADDHGQFIDPALHHAVSLTMQWLLGQENVDTALEQVNRLLVKINLQLREDRRSRRTQHLKALGPLVSEPFLINTGWCVVKSDDEAIPYELLGMHGDSWALLNRSATALLEIPAERFLRDLDSGLIEEAESFDESFLERIADATLTASLNAVHAYTWQDPASGCLKRNALMDELERRLAHPVTEPATFCALIEIPAMRPSLSSLPGDELTVMQKRTGEILQDWIETGEHCGRLSDVTFLMVFSPQDPDRLSGRLSQLKTDLESLHPEWKMMGAVVPLIGDETSPAPSSVLRRANQACAGVRQHAGFDLSRLGNVPPVTNQIDPLPFPSLYLRCQKIASCKDAAPSHYEILLGVNEELIPSHTTQSFVVMAEQTGRINDLDIWVLRSALEWMDRNTDGLDQLSGMSVNLSGASLTLDDHVDTMVSLLSDYPHLTNKLIIEVTETAAICNLDVAVRSLRKLRKLGCRVALDDFGSGYSSYGYLRKLPLDYLKIDGIYIRNILTDKTDQALTASMVDVAHALGLKVIAEFVDSEAAYSWLKDIGVDYVQGYWVHKPERLDTLMLH